MMSRNHDANGLRGVGCQGDLGLTSQVIGGAIDYVHAVLDSIDEKLTELEGGSPLAELVELANLSAIIGNLFRGGVVQCAGGRFRSNSPHTYPDLLSCDNAYPDVEIKVALENNKPKGHLVKPGPHIIVRYVLGQPDGTFARGKGNRGTVAWIWEVRIGRLTAEHFNFSNTDGDSGKTAVINSAGMGSLESVYCDFTRCPASPTGSVIRELRARYGRSH